ncbi:magnesium transporter CorA family protein [Bacillus thermotolerans]|uniref:magnesium transporter CorA family protein n=1 Tax=Bacillus thermotolerans TaxID=1221996 RepID=UPI00058062E1|nr:magnesium transporter CorA family protein [Bacillus thermotolerans]KKB38834.1 Magnesium and cobalt transport protein CorA [Bacillus thermotolerans]
MEHTFNDGKWCWHELGQFDPGKDESFMKDYKSYDQWAEATKKNQTNTLQEDTDEKGKEALWGSLVYVQDAEEKDNKRVFHFFVTRQCLITDNLDVSMLEGVSLESIKRKMDEADNSVEGFMVMLGEIVIHFLGKIDAFEVKMRNVLWKIKEKNNVDLLDDIIKSRHQLLIWKNLLIPVQEIKYGVEEVFGKDAAEGIHFNRAVRRLERIQMLVNEYEKELGAVVELENTVSAHRGNEIMKTLTVLTTLFTPVASWGAIWGMNFEIMPELKWKFGYLFSWGVIGITTLALYWYLKKKGWMGDILRGKKRNSFFK